eukprot:2158120-Pyramimonas_sp.AAC.1
MCIRDSLLPPRVTDQCGMCAPPLYVGSRHPDARAGMATQMERRRRAVLTCRSQHACRGITVAVIFGLLSLSSSS